MDRLNHCASTLLPKDMHSVKISPFLGGKMVNLYEILGISPLANTHDIQRAIQKKAQSQSLDIEQLTKIRNILMNDTNRTNYDSALFAKNPEILKEAQQEQAKEQEKLAKYKKNTGGFSLGKLAEGVSQSTGGLGKLMKNPLLQGVLGNMSEMSLDDIERQYAQYLFDGEHFTMGYQLVRDLILFTDQRILFVDKQGATGKKQHFKSIYLMNIVDVEMETAGMGFDDSEITITCLTGVYRRSYNENMKTYKFEFPKTTNIVPLYTMLGSLALQNRLQINEQD